jgi:hypothetical protein
MDHREQRNRRIAFLEGTKSAKIVHSDDDNEFGKIKMGKIARGSMRPWCMRNGVRMERISILMLIGVEKVMKVKIKEEDFVPLFSFCNHDRCHNLELVFSFWKRGPSEELGELTTSIYK